MRVSGYPVILDSHQCKVVALNTEILIVHSPLTVLGFFMKRFPDSLPQTTLLIFGLLFNTAYENVYACSHW